MSELGSAKIRHHFYGAWVAQAVYAAGRLELADHVADVTALAERTQTDPDALYRNGGFTLARIVRLPYFTGGAELVAIETVPVP